MGSSGEKTYTAGKQEVALTEDLMSKDRLLKKQVHWSIPLIKPLQLKEKKLLASQNAR